MLAKIKSKKEVAKGILSVTFDLLGKKIDFKPGQYTLITLIDPPFSDDKGNERFFSINNPPEQKEVIIIATRLRDSAFKKSLNELPIGSEVKIGKIEGSFTLPENKSKPLVFIAGGIGITPFMSMLRHIRNNNLNYDVTLIYSNKDRQSTAYIEELEGMANPLAGPDSIGAGGANFKLILTMTQDPLWNGEKRRVDGQFIKDYVKNPNSATFYIAGPPGLVDAISASLRTFGIINIITENFTGY